MYDPDLSAPPLHLLLRETRAPLEAMRFFLGARFMSDLPRGDGHPVLLIPGFGTSGSTMRPLAKALERLGYACVDWGQGRNLGMRPRIKQNLSMQVQALHERYDAKVSLIGWSLGGVFAREMARAQPEHIRCIVTLGSPFNGSPSANNMMPLFRLANRGKPVKLDPEGFTRRIAPPPVPCIAIHTKTDGIVAWESSVEDAAPNVENVEVRGTHFALVTNLEVLRAIAFRLSRTPL